MKEYNVINYEQYRKSIDSDIKYGSKFTNLAILDKHFPVPCGICITSNFLNKIVFQSEKLKEQIKKIFIDIESTSGCYLLETSNELNNIFRSYVIQKKDYKELYDTILRNFPENTKLAVRSSASHEDTSINSFAGIYDTKLNVLNANEAIDFIRQCIINYYSYSAIIARIRSGNFSPLIELNIIIQQMIEAKYSGVGFSKQQYHTGVLIEWVEGLGEQLVSGETEANVYIPGEENKNVPPSIKQMLDKLHNNILKIKKILNYEVDVEWAFDGEEIYIIQARPITTLTEKSIEQKAVIRTHPLYLDANIKYNVDLGSCKKIYEEYTSKRSPLYILAAKNGINTGISYILEFNLKGLMEKGEKLLEIFHEAVSDKVVIDVNKSIRQNIIHLDALEKYLKDMFSYSDEYQIHAIIIREYIKGEYGFISQNIGEYQLLIEGSADGLLAINRGLANCEDIIISSDNKVVNGEKERFSQQAIDKIMKFSKVIHSGIGNAKIEWVLYDKAPYFIDFSIEDKNTTYYYSNENNVKVIYPGSIDGQVLNLDGKALMERLSISPGISVNKVEESIKLNDKLLNLIKEIKTLKEKPIIFVDKPYAILSVLIEHVSGFVFEKGSLLCHLSILLRENKIPSAIVYESKKRFHNGDRVIFVNGSLMEVN